MRLPDFMIIGAMKCATSTLHEQLARQPGMFMSTPKEPRFFSDDAQYARGIDWYAGLFADAPASALCGESSTHYTKLPTHPHTLERMRRHLGDDVKLIYVMRNPLDRLTSHYVHEWTQRVMSAPLESALDRHPELVDYGLYAMQLEPYLRTFGSDRVLPVFLDRLKAHPQAELERVCRFLGYADRPQWVSDVEPQNVSSQRMRRSPLRDAVVELAPLRWIRRRFVPRSVRERVKRLWMMNDRPKLPEARRQQLEMTFDEDLARLGAWLGWSLSCSNFAEATRDRVPQWQCPPERERPSSRQAGAA